MRITGGGGRRSVDARELLGFFLELGLMSLNDLTHSSQESALISTMVAMADNAGGAAAINLLRLDAVCLQGATLTSLGDRLELVWVPLVATVADVVRILLS